MVKEQISVTLDRELLDRVDDYHKNKFSGLSRSAVLEILLRKALSSNVDISVTR